MDEELYYQGKVASNLSESISLYGNQEGATGRLETTENLEKLHSTEKRMTLRECYPGSCTAKLTPL